MTVAEKIKLALRGNRETRMLLLRDSNRMIRRFVLQNPRVGDDEIIAICKNRSADEELLRIIADNRDWTKNYQVRSSLTTNPEDAARARAAVRERASTIATSACSPRARTSRRPSRRPRSASSPKPGAGAAADAAAAPLSASRRGQIRRDGCSRRVRAVHRDALDDRAEAAREERGVGTVAREVHARRPASRRRPRARTPRRHRAAARTARRAGAAARRPRTSRNRCRCPASVPAPTWQTAKPTIASRVGTAPCRRAPSSIVRRSRSPRSSPGCSVSVIARHRRGLRALRPARARRSARPRRRAAGARRRGFAMTTVRKRGWKPNLPYSADVLRALREREEAGVRDAGAREIRP